jgi:hypothetical protein
MSELCTHCWHLVEQGNQGIEDPVFGKKPDGRMYIREVCCQCGVVRAMLSAHHREHGPYYPGRVAVVEE